MCYKLNEHRVDCRVWSISSVIDHLVGNCILHVFLFLLKVISTVCRTNFIGIDEIKLILDVA